MASIGVDFNVFDGKFQGSRSHLLGIYGELVLQCPEHHFYFFLDRTADLAKLPAFQNPNVSLVHMPPGNPFVRLGWHLPRLRKQYRLDILHTQYVLPFWPAKGNAVTIHDVLFEPFPEFFQPLFVLRSRLMMRWAAHRADMLFTVSEYSRQEIARRYGVAASQISVQHNAVDMAHFFPGTAGNEYLATRGLSSGKYLLTVGRIEPRKNHATILRAYSQLTGNPPPLVIVGQRDFGYGEFETAISALPPTHQVIVLSDVGDLELPALYRHALAFVYPSFAEGFGMPPLEGLASGVPVITSNTTAIPEVVGDAGLLVDPNSEAELAKAMRRICSDELLRADLIQKGLQRAQHFTWRKSSEELAKAFNRYLGSTL